MLSVTCPETMLYSSCNCKHSYLLVISCPKLQATGFPSGAAMLSTCEPRSLFLAHPQYMDPTSGLFVGPMIWPQKVPVSIPTMGLLSLAPMGGLCGFGQPRTRHVHAVERKLEGPSFTSSYRLSTLGHIGGAPWTDPNRAAFLYVSVRSTSRRAAVLRSSLFICFRTQSSSSHWPHPLTARCGWLQ